MRCATRATALHSCHGTNCMHTPSCRRYTALQQYGMLPTRSHYLETDCGIFHKHEHSSHSSRGRLSAAALSGTVTGEGHRAEEGHRLYHGILRKRNLHANLLIGGRQKLNPRRIDEVLHNNSYRIAMTHFHLPQPNVLEHFVYATSTEDRY